jgi:CheY-like chemotaxis protein
VSLGASTADNFVETCDLPKHPDWLNENRRCDRCRRVRRCTNVDGRWSCVGCVGAQSAAQALDATTIAPVRRRVLVVDDEPSVLTFAECALTQAKYDVVTARDGEEALRLVDTRRAFDAFVLDLMMPKMMGDELARRLRRRDPDVKVLYFTGYSDLLFAERKVLWTHEAFLEKPVTDQELSEAVSLLLFGQISDRGRHAPLPNPR